MALVRVTMEFVYNLDDREKAIQEAYGTKDLDEALQIDREQFQQDPIIAFELAASDIDVRVEAVE